MSEKKIGILGGSFNPIHNGHLALAASVCRELQLDQLIFIPAGFPPHKEKSCLAPAEHRYAMVLLAAEQDPRFLVSRLELDATETTYTVKTLRVFRELFHEDDDLFFIMGADSLVDLVNWWSFQELVQLCTFVAVARPGVPRGAMEAQAALLKSQHGARVLIVDMPPMDVSSSEIRKRIADGQDTSSLTPPAVADYIARNGLYGGAADEPKSIEDGA